jgi:hypothetical protein
MPGPADRFQATNYQAAFARRWGHLRRARVRALAWLLDAPDLLDVHDPHWQGRIATLGSVTPETAEWLARLDADPGPLDAALGVKLTNRLGLYAEKLMAFYFAEQGTLLAHGLQVRAARNDTVGEFDFLLDDGAGGALHIEFATKFYLLRAGDVEAGAADFDQFVGPNLADSLGRKMRKVLDHQLLLGSHPAAQALLPRPVHRAQALIKGWLFYPVGVWRARQGIAAGHCRGFWCALSEVDGLACDRFLILPKLQWLAPFQAQSAAQSAVWMLDRAQLKEELAARFAESGTPVLVALAREEPDGIVEVERGFIVPDDWHERALT